MRRIGWGLMLVTGVALLSGVALCDDELRRAVEGNDIPRVRELLAEGVDPDSGAEDDVPALFYAIGMADFGPHDWWFGSGDPELVELLLEHGADPNFEGDSPYGSLVALLSISGDLRLLELLLQHGADPDLGHALVVAAGSDRPAAGLMLLEHGADPNVRSREDGIPLAAAAEKGHLELVRALIEAGAEVNPKPGMAGLPLQSAAEEGHAEIVELLLANGAEVTLHVAAILGDVERIVELLDGGADVNEGDVIDATPLLLAAGHDQAQVVELLMGRGGDPSLADGIDRTPLAHAMLYGQVDAVEALLANGADPNILSEHGSHLLQTGWGQRAVTLLLDHGADPNGNPERPGRPLYWAARRGGARRGGRASSCSRGHARRPCGGNAGVRGQGAGVHRWWGRPEQDERARRESVARGRRRQLSGHRRMPHR